jgi:hypothetical protein
LLAGGIRILQGLQEGWRGDGKGEMRVTGWGLRRAEEEEERVI